jgi:hypothetical protein
VLGLGVLGLGVLGVGGVRRYAPDNDGLLPGLAVSVVSAVPLGLLEAELNIEARGGVNGSDGIGGAENASFTS